LFVGGFFSVGAEGARLGFLVGVDGGARLGFLVGAVGARLGFLVGTECPYSFSDVAVEITFLDVAVEKFWIFIWSLISSRISSPACLPLRASRIMLKRIKALLLIIMILFVFFSNI
jgi:hypothetical protein